MKEKYTEDDICNALEKAEQMTMKSFKSFEDEVDDKDAFRTVIHETLSIFTIHFSQIIKDRKED
jgi:hypothetical protein